jgi:hypothetical protein
MDGFSFELKFYRLKINFLYRDSSLYLWANPSSSLLTKVFTQIFTTRIFMSNILLVLTFCLNHKPLKQRGRYKTYQSQTLI